MKDGSSFRDPDGFIFYQEKRLLRAITFLYKDNFDHLINSGLYFYLVQNGFLIPHQEVFDDNFQYSGLYKIIEPERIRFISYPYEWSFSQLKDAALLTLEIQRIALEYGMSLKDASAYNIQFHNGHPIFIDTLSFEIYHEDKPWKAYKQFCQHFLAPLALMGKSDIRLNGLLKEYIDGIPLDLAIKLLPWRTKLNLGLLLHLYLHSSAQKKFQANKIKLVEIKKKFSKNNFLALINSLKSTTSNILWKSPKTEWGGYYSDSIHLPEYINHKKDVISECLLKVKPSTLWDMGANDGYFSRLALDNGTFVVAFDIDPVCVEVNYLEVIKKEEVNILPILLDLTNPSPSIGWANCERKNISSRGPVDLLMVLALIHHLAISNNLPLIKIADYFRCMAQWLIIEFVPKSDEKVQILLKNREDIFPEYTSEGFENAFKVHYDIIVSYENPYNERVIYLMKLK